jgi:hypothetical protein
MMLELAKYLRTKERPALSPLLSMPMIQTAVLLGLGWLISGVDTYLHATTSAINLNYTVAYFEDRPENSLQSLRPIYTRGQQGALSKSRGNFGAQVNTTLCPGGKAPEGYFDVPLLNISSCGVIIIDLENLGHPSDFANGESSTQIVNLAQGIQTYSNQSDVFRVYTVDDILFLGPADLSAKVDFKASSIGVRTQCTSITNQCTFSSVDIDDATLTDIFLHNTHLLKYDCPVPFKEETWSGAYVQALKLADLRLFQPPTDAPPNTFFLGSRVGLDVQSPVQKQEKSKSSETPSCNPKAVFGSRFNSATLQC